MNLSLVIFLLPSITDSLNLPSPLKPRTLTITILHARTQIQSSSSRRRRRLRRGPKHYYYEDVPDDDDDTSNTNDISCPILAEEQIDHAGLSKSIDAEYATEEAKINLTFWQILQREKYRQPSQFSQHMSPLARTIRRMDFKKGNIESKYELMSKRNYGDPRLLDKDHLADPPTLDDLNEGPAPFKQTYWKEPLWRVGVVAMAYFSFPWWCKLFVNFQTIEPKKFNTVVNQLGPNVGVLYATILALTLAVLYNRFTRIQQNATTEATLLSQLTRNLLSLFQDEPRWATDACQMIANQLRIMLSRTRGWELLSIMKADTYSNILALVDDYHYLHGCDDTFGAAQESTMANIRADLTHIMEVRALRLSDEASSLPPTHFLLLTSLSAVSSIAFVTASLAVVKDLNDPPQEARLLFAGLMALYILFFNFCRDLNGPFQGVYQIKRSNAVSHLLQTKWLIVNQLGNKINFGEFDDEGPPNMSSAKEDQSFLDRIKSFFSDTEHEQIAQVELNTMANLVKELQAHNEVVIEETNVAQNEANKYALRVVDDLPSYNSDAEELNTESDTYATMKELEAHDKKVDAAETIVKEESDDMTEERDLAPSISDTEELLNEINQTIMSSASDLRLSADTVCAPENTHTEPDVDPSQHGVNGLRDTEHPLTLALHYEEGKPTNAKETHSEEPTGTTKQFDYASYFRSTSGFSS